MRTKKITIFNPSSQYKTLKVEFVEPFNFLKQKELEVQYGDVTGFDYNSHFSSKYFQIFWTVKNKFGTKRLITYARSLTEAEEIQRILEKFRIPQTEDEK